MRKLQTLFCVPLLLLSAALDAQENPAAVREADFSSNEEKEGLRFSPAMPPPSQIAGAPKAYYAYFWEFGDGSFSREENPLHGYAEPGEYIVSLDATAHYDDGRKPKKKKRTVKPGARSEALAGTGLPDVFEKKSRQGLAMAANSQPRAGEELTCIVSYRNNGLATTSGRLHLFFNEKKFPAEHFAFLEARTHFGETADPLISQALPEHPAPFVNWATLHLASPAGVSTFLWDDDTPPYSILDDMLREGRGTYRDEKAWRFTDLQPGEKRNFFCSLAATEKMLKDTNAFIYMTAVLAPEDPGVPPERFVLEMEIVSSHDPNAIAVSDNRVNYRVVGNKKLDYKVRFQNNGESPAGTVQVKVNIPEGLDMARMRPLDWYPECPICPKTPGPGSCLDTASSSDGLVFTFRNIYLPGSNQEGVNDRDSTQGFVRYRIEADKDMPKRSFHSRAEIVFDKNPPIFTNFTKTRFKPGLSPGLKAGYHYDPDGKEDRYVFLGASFSPYKSWRIYPQIEFLTGIKGQSALPEAVFRDSVIKAVDQFKVVISTDSTIRRERGFVSFEIPVMLRKNFTRAFGAGLGGTARVLLENGETRTTVHRVRAFQPHPGVQLPPPAIFDSVRVDPYSATRTRFAVFADLTVGSVRAGPNLGIRAGAILERRQRARPFVQVAVEMKL